MLLPHHTSYTLYTVAVAEQTPRKVRTHSSALTELNTDHGRYDADVKILILELELGEQMYVTMYIKFFPFAPFVNSKRKVKF